MRLQMIGLAAGLFVTAASATYASTPAASGNDLVTAPSGSTGLYGARTTKDAIVIARRGRGADDPGGDDNRGRSVRGKGGKGRGGHDDGPNHDRNDDHGNDGPSHS